MDRAVRMAAAATDPEQAVALLVATVERLGGRAVPARLQGPDVIPVDLTFGLGEPLVVAAPALSPARRHLEHHLPTLIEAFRTRVQQLGPPDRREGADVTDRLTGVPNRAGLPQVLHRLWQGDTLALLDIDGLQAVNDAHGRAAGDEVLQTFAGVIAGNLPAGSRVGRLGSDEFLVVLRRTPLPAARATVQALRAAWAARRPWPVSFSAGFAQVRDDLAPHAVMAAAAADLSRAQAWYSARELAPQRA